MKKILDIDNFEIVLFGLLLISFCAMMCEFYINLMFK